MSRSPLAALKVSGYARPGILGRFRPLERKMIIRILLVFIIGATIALTVGQYVHASLQPITAALHAIR